MKKIFLILMIIVINCFANEALKESEEMNIFDEQVKFYNNIDISTFNSLLEDESLHPNEIIQYNITTITDASLIKILQDKKDSKEIKCISINGSFLTDEGIANITKYCPNLEILYLHGDNITDKGIEILSLGCPKLRILSLNAINPGLITDTGLSFLITNCQKLKDLFLINHRNITELGIEAFEKIIKCDYFSFTPNSSFYYDEEEQYIELCGFGCTDEKFLEIIKTRPDPSLIKKINIAYEPLLSEKAFFYIAEYCPNLIDLRISDNILTDNGLIALSHNCKNLRSFAGNLSNSKVTIQGLLTFAEACSNITDLNLMLGNSNIKDEDISILITKLPLLEQISFIGYISEDDELRIFETNDENEKQLYKYSEKVEENLQSTPSLLSDISIINIAKNCHNLKRIELIYNPNVSYLGIIELLKCCPHLKELYLYGTSLTNEDVDRILELFPNIDIEYGIFPNKMEKICNL